MNNATEFLSYFNKIEDLLKKKARLNNKFSGYMTFNDLIRESSRFNSIVRRFSSDMKEYAELRNAIVHGSKDDEIIAMPLPKTVKEIKRIFDKLNTPPLASKFRKEKVILLSINDPLSKALELMLKHAFSQMPVLENDRIVALLSSNAISRWLANNINEDIISILETEVYDILAHAEFKENFRILSARTNCYDILEVFQRSITSGQYLEAVILTQNGKPNEDPIGIFTIWDLPMLEKALNS